MISGITAILLTALVSVVAVVAIAAFVEITPALASVFTAGITVIGQIAMKHVETLK
jgi:hypothetical protein